MLPALITFRCPCCAHCPCPHTCLQLLLVVAVMLLEIVLIWLLPTLSGPPLCAPRRVLGRLILLSLPSFRRTTVGMGRMLERPPLSGPLGALVDLARLILGEQTGSAA